MGISGSRLDRTLTSLPDGERYFGLENFGNTCYCNSVLQALYFCQPFREGILKYAASLDKETEDTVYTCLADLFQQVGASWIERELDSWDFAVCNINAGMAGVCKVHQIGDN